MSSRNALFTLVILTLLLSCRRKAIHKEHPEFVGGWHHTEYPSKNRYYLSIGEHSSGTATLYDSTGKELTFNGENPRRWRYNEHNKRLSNGIISPKFQVDQLPSIATAQIIDGYDTIVAGETYCIINGGYYKKNP